MVDAVIMRLPLQIVKLQSKVLTFAQKELSMPSYTTSIVLLTKIFVEKGIGKQS